MLLTIKSDWSHGILPVIRNDWTITVCVNSGYNLFRLYSTYKTSEFILLGISAICGVLFKYTSHTHLVIIVLLHFGVTNSYRSRRLSVGHKTRKTQKITKKNFSKVTKTEWKTSLIIAELRAALALRKEVLGNETSNALMLRTGTTSYWDILWLFRS